MRQHARFSRHAPAQRAVATAALALVLASALAGTHAAHAQRRPQPLFAEDVPLELTIEAPFEQLSRARRDEPEVDGRLSYVEPGGERRVIAVEIEPRGLSRLRHCRFPPLRLGFDARETEGTLFEGQDRLKLVTHCMPAPRYADFVAREYQIYRLYNALTDRSFRVRWLSIRYVDTDVARAAFTAPGFLIEADRAVAARLGLERLALESIEPETLDPAAAALTAVFQFMIGNADWSAARGPAGEACCHNGELLGIPGRPAGRIALPYDFDQAALVDADYAVHNEGIGLRGDQRAYRGFCVFGAELEAAIAAIVGARQAWLGILDAAPVSERGRRWAVRYIEDGYAILADPGTVERRMSRRCRASED